MSASAAPPSKSDTDTLLRVHNNPVFQDSKVQDAGGEGCSCMSNGTLAHVVDALSLATAVAMVVAVHSSAALILSFNFASCFQKSRTLTFNTH